MSLNKLSVLLFAVLVSVAAYGGGTSSLLVSYGTSGSGPPPPPSSLMLTDRTITSASPQQATLGFRGAFNGDWGSIFTASNGVSTTIPDEYYVGHPGPFEVDNLYELRYHVVSGTLDAVPLDGSFNPLPADTWSFSEWTGTTILGFDIFNAIGKTTNGTAVFTLEIRPIDLSEAPASATITTTRTP